MTPWTERSWRIRHGLGLNLAPSFTCLRKSCQLSKVNFIALLCRLRIPTPTSQEVIYQDVRTKSVICLTWSSAHLNARTPRKEISLMCSPTPYLRTGELMQINTCLSCFAFYLFLAWVSRGSILLYRVLMGGRNPGKSSLMNSVHYIGVPNVQFPKAFIYMNGWSLLGNQGMVPSTLTRKETEIQRRRVIWGLSWD